MTKNPEPADVRQTVSVDLTEKAIAAHDTARVKDEDARWRDLGDDLAAAAEIVKEGRDRVRRRRV